MILVRDIFRLKFGKAKEALEMLKRNVVNMTANRGYGPDRFLTDLTGPYYTLIMETTYNDLNEFEQSIHKMFGDEKWRKEYQGFAELVDSGKREIFNIVQVGQQEPGQQRAQATAQVGKGR